MTPRTLHLHPKLLDGSDALHPASGTFTLDVDASIISAKAYIGNRSAEQLTRKATPRAVTPDSVEESVDATVRHRGAGGTARTDLWSQRANQATPEYEATLS
jgi:hypothetical protein